jgi:hypothetical protein
MMPAAQRTGRLSGMNGRSVDTLAAAGSSQRSKERIVDNLGHDPNSAAEHGSDVELA